MGKQSGSAAAVAIAAPQNVALRLQALAVGWRGAGNRLRRFIRNASRPLTLGDGHYPRIWCAW